MAEIDVVKGRSNSWIWWVIAAIALVMLLIFMMQRDRTERPTGSPSSAAEPATTIVVAV